MSSRLLIPGIIGGAGPGATARFYLDIINRCLLAGLDRRPPLFVASLDICLASERELLAEGVGIECYTSALISAARSLEAAGAEFLTMPCNTLHVLLPELEAAVSIPVLSIIEAVMQEVEQTGCRTVGLLSTTTTAHTGLFERGLRERNIEVIQIPKELQAVLEAKIQSELAVGIPHETDELNRAIDRYYNSNGVDLIIAGCTELKALMASWETSARVIDSLDALSAAVVARMLKSNES